MEEILQKIIETLEGQGVVVEKKRIYRIHMPGNVFTMRVNKADIEIRTACGNSCMWINKLSGPGVNLLSYYSGSGQLAALRVELKKMLSEELSFAKLAEKFCPKIVELSFEGIAVFKGGDTCARLSGIQGYTFDISLNEPLSPKQVENINSMINFFQLQSVSPGRRFHIVKVK